MTLTADQQKECQEIGREIMDGIDKLMAMKVDIGDEVYVPINRVLRGRVVEVSSDGTIAVKIEGERFGPFEWNEQHRYWQVASIDGYVSGDRDKTWTEHFAECIATLTNPERDTEWASAAEEIMRGAVLLDEDQIRREEEHAADGELTLEEHRELIATPYEGMLHAME